MSQYTAQSLRLRHFQYVSAVANTGSFTKAAALCHVTQSTLSLGVKEFEDTLGQQIFDRTSRKITLTAFGESLLTDIRDILDKAEGLLTRARQNKGQYSGPYRLGAIPTIAPYMIPVILPELTKNHPELDLRLKESTSETLVQDVQDGAIDAALLAFPYDTGTLATQIIGEERFYLLRPKSGRPATILNSDEIDADKLMLLEDGHCLRDHALAVCARQDRESRQTYQATSLTTLVQLVSHGFGTTLLPAMAVHEMPLPDDLEAVPVGGDQPGRHIGLIWRRKSPLASLTGALGREIENIETLAGLLQ